MRKVIIIAPYWFNDSHMGKKRVNRYLKCLSSVNTPINLLAAGFDNYEELHEWGKLIVVKDPVYLFSSVKNKTSQGSSSTQKKKKKSLIRNWIERIVFFPDRTSLWSIKVAFSFRKHFEIGHNDLIISSSPPESPHILNTYISKRVKANSIIDMRDGWIDDPLKLYLNKNSILSNVEKKLEKFVVTHSKMIFVSSTKWSELLLSRFPSKREKVKVLTNAYPNCNFNQKISDNSLGKITLLYTGRFRSSRSVNAIEELLDPLINGKLNDRIIDLIIYGELTLEDERALSLRQNDLLEKRIFVSIKEPIPSSELFKEIENASGLLLLAVSKAAIPGKLFDYIPSGKPIFIVGQEDSSVFEITSELPQVFFYDLGKKNLITVSDFFNFITNYKSDYEIPPQFDEDNICKSLLSTLKNI